MAWSHRNQSPLLTVITWYSTNHWLRQNNVGAAFKVRLSISQLRFARVCLLCLYWVLLKSSPLGQQREPQFAHLDRAWKVGQWTSVLYLPLSLPVVIVIHVTQFLERPRKKRQDSRTKFTNYFLLPMVSGTYFNIISVHSYEFLGLQSWKRKKQPRTNIYVW